MGSGVSKRGQEGTAVAGGHALPSAKQATTIDKPVQQSTPSPKRGNGTGFSLDGRVSGAAAGPDDGIAGANAVDSDAELEENVKVVDSARASELLWEYCTYIFHKADLDGDGKLDAMEFANVVQSQTLNLNVTDAEAEELMSDATDGKGDFVEFEQFVPVMKSLMGRRALRQRQANVKGWRWYVMYVDDDPDSLPVYYDTQQEAVTYDRPPGVEQRQQSETQAFEQMQRISDGMLITSYVADDGGRMYLDFGTGEWLPFPNEWYDQFEVLGNDLPDGGDDVWKVDIAGTEGALERFVHPVTGEEVETSFEGGTRLFFDKEVGEWIPIPIALEKYVPSVVAGLVQLEEEFPTWRGGSEKIMALRSNSYDVRATAAWRRLEETYMAVDGSIDDGGQDGAFSATGLLSQQRNAEKAATEVGGELEVIALQREVDDGKALLDLQKTRISALELQLEAKQLTDDSASKVLLEQQTAKIEALTAELEVLKAGGELKDTLAIKEKALADLELAHSALVQERDAAKQKQAAASSRLQFELQALKSKQEALRSAVNKNFGEDMITLMKEAQSKVVSSFRTAIESATSEVVAKYRYEVRQRKMLYNKLQELKGNIRVFCRVRRDDRVKCVLQFPDYKGLGTPTEIVCPNPRDERDRKRFEFDRVYSTESTQEEVFEDTEAIITSCVDGYNTCIIAYGQTGSGKTFTMMGPEDNIGVNKRAVAELLRVCEERTDVNYELTVSLLEIYNEKITDLLAASMENQQCDVRQDPKTKAHYVSNLTERPFDSVDDIIQTLADGDSNRHVAATKMNSQSSRSHLVLTITIAGHDTVSGQSSTGRLTLVDLAGSERVAKTEAAGQRLVEAAAINKSLTALGQVFAALRTSQSHVPYRNSKLTHLLADSLGGDAKTCVFINVSPADSNLSETLSTLKFGQAIRTIELGPMGKQGKKAAAKKR
eukprot:m.448895 g.448895  ORF g.448895 m.448895 type:complete len:943 (+) comp20315_c14_seq55:137-2965(+)